ncbi:MAG: hypothetical protein JNL67_02905 [Planctomycetaceae bacterium]|nr:hypothetical protein [Planctomycetaceae bacterium]
MTLRDPQGLWLHFGSQIKKSLSKLLGMATCCGALAMCGSANAQLQTVAFDDFEDLHTTMVPFTVAPNVYADGTDYSTQIRTGTPRAWTIDNSQMGNPAGSSAGGVCLEPGYNGWTAMDVTSWTAEQGVQAGRTALGLATRNTALVADPDAYYDFDSPAQPGDAYNSYISRSYDLTGFNLSTLEISFDYEFAIENNQRGTIEVSFDGGTTWQLVLDLIKGSNPNNTILRGPGTFVAGTHFNPTSTQMLLRIGCITAGNNWWFAVDNVRVKTSDGFDDLEDFEGLPMVSFLNAPPGARPPLAPPFDGTDFTNVIPNWTIDNSLMNGFCREAGFDGWTALDIKCWVNQQGGDGRSLLDFGGFNQNAALVADGDAFYDFGRNLSNTGSPPPNAVNTYIQREYDLSTYDNRTLQISLDYEFRIENQQRGTIEVSFDGGQTWILLRELVKGTSSNGTYLIDSPVFVAGTDFVALQTKKMILRLGYLDSDNNWWFAVDNVLVQAETLSFLPGDANDDGFFDFGDIEAFVLALMDPDAYAQQYPNVNVNNVLDFYGDGNFDFGDLEAFVVALLE